METCLDEKPAGLALRYHGGKGKLAPWVISHFPAHTVYVEPFAGGAAVLLSKPRSKIEVYNDLDRQAWNVFMVLRDPELRERLEELLVLTPFARDEFDLSYEPSDDPVEQARRTILRGFMGMSTRGTTGCHRTGFRYSDTAGSAAEKVWSRYPERVSAIGKRFAGVVIENKPALELIEKMDMRSRNAEDTLYYIDPPYLGSVRQQGAHWRRAYRCDMTDDESHRTLAERLRRVKGMVIISGYPSPLYDELYEGWTCVTRAVRTDGQSSATECLWINPKTAGQLLTLGL